MSKTNNQKCANSHSFMFIALIVFLEMTLLLGLPLKSSYSIGRPDYDTVFFLYE